MKKYSNITDNSLQIKPGGLFISIPTTKAQDYLNDAIARGASAVMLPSKSNLYIPYGITVLRSDNIRVDAAKIAAEYYPNTPKNICAITGTKGKTSIVSFITQILGMLNKSAASIGTLGVVSKNWTEPGVNTTPFTIQLHEYMSRLAADGVEYLAIEASSHGIEQHRLDYIKFDSVGFSNLSRDHLDYHHTMDNYFSAKEKLFTEFKYNTAVVNMDDEYAHKIRTYGNLITVGYNGKEMRIKNITPMKNGQLVNIEYFGRDVFLNTPLIGEFQVYNILMAIGLVIGMGIVADSLPIERIFTELRAPSGRAELVGNTHTGGTIYIDYAHTPASLEQILTAMRRHTDGRLHVLFGCGGDRDTGKRAIMGEIALRLADIVIVTDDNPRTENATTIRAQIMSGCPNAIEIADRGLAIETAIKGLAYNDILIIAGKGHENYQIIGQKKLYFSDIEVAKRFVAKIV